MGLISWMFKLGFWIMMIVNVAGVLFAVGIIGYFFWGWFQ